MFGRRFGWLWGAYAVSTVGTWLAFDAFSIIAIVVLRAGPAAVSALSAAGLAVGAVVAVPLGPWVEFRRKRPVMMAMDLARFVAVGSIPAAYGFGWFGFGQLLVVSMVVAAADITFTAASGAYLKGLLHGPELLTANARFESTTWTATMLGPPLGGAAIGAFGPMATVLANAVSFVLSALGIGAIGGGERRPESGDSQSRLAGLVEGWRYILAHRALRLLFANSMVVSGLIMGTLPVVAVLMLGRLGFATWQYGLAFGLPCVGGLLGSRLARPLVRRYGSRRVMLVSGTLRVCWLGWLAFVPAGTAGLVLVIAAQFGVVTTSGVFNPVYATYRLEQVAPDRVARVLSAWTVSTRTGTAVLTALWGLLAAATGPRVAIGIAGVLLAASPVLLPFWRKTPDGALMAKTVYNSPDDALVRVPPEAGEDAG